MVTVSDSASQIQSDAERELAQVSDLPALEEWRLRYLGRKGRLPLLLRTLPELSLEERRKVGSEGNAVLARLKEAHEQRLKALQDSRLEHVIESERLDVTLPGPPLRRGRLHPITQTLRDLLSAFTSMGFQTVEGPEIEWDRYNFEALRIPQDHPARDMWDTMWIDYEVNGVRPMLLRTHTSPNQIRVMETTEPPIRIVVPGKCYRFEATDATHEWMLTQIEGLAVDDGISMTDLKGTLAEFARRIFGQDRRVAFRCSYFPFVEPGMEVQHRLLHLPRRGLPYVPPHRLDRDPGRRHGAPGDPHEHGLRRREVHRLRLRHGRRAHRAPALRRRRHPPLLRERPALSAPVLRLTVARTASLALGIR